MFYLYFFFAYKVTIIGALCKVICNMKYDMMSIFV